MKKSILVMAVLAAFSANAFGADAAASGVPAAAQTAPKATHKPVRKHSKHKRVVKHKAVAAAPAPAPVAAPVVVAAPAPAPVMDFIVINQDENIYTFGVDQLYTNVGGEAAYGNRFTFAIMGTRLHRFAGRDWTIGVQGATARFNQSSLSSATTFDGVFHTDLGAGWSASLLGGVGLTSGAINNSTSTTSLSAGYDLGVEFDYKLDKNLSLKFGGESTNAYSYQSAGALTTTRSTARILTVGVGYTF